MPVNLHITIAESSAIVRLGLEVQLKYLPGFRIRLSEVTSPDGLAEGLRRNKPDVLIVNPAIPGAAGLQHLKEECGCPNVKCCALLLHPEDPALLRTYDAQVSLFDDAGSLRQLLEQLMAEKRAAEEDDDSQTLSSREKEIVVCVVKGMTNREIADRLYLSTHTVVTHRRNIARKLQVHSASGLTVYAIANKLIELKDLNG